MRKARTCVPCVVSPFFWTVLELIGASSPCTGRNPSTQGSSVEEGELGRERVQVPGPGEPAPAQRPRTRVRAPATPATTRDPRESRGECGAAPGQTAGRGLGLAQKLPGLRRPRSEAPCTLGRIERGVGIAAVERLVGRPRPVAPCPAWPRRPAVTATVAQAKESAAEQERRPGRRRPLARAPRPRGPCRR